MFKLKIIIYIFILFIISTFDFKLTNLLAKDGGYIIGYSRDTDIAIKTTEIKQVNKTAKIQNSLVETEKNKATLEKTNKHNDVLVKDIREVYEKRLKTKDKKIEFLKNRISRLEDQIQEQETNFYLSQHNKNEQYLVKEGDSLWKIAAKNRIYGNPKRWITIYNANMDKIKEPNLIYAGQLFEIHR